MCCDMVPNASLSYHTRSTVLSQKSPNILRMFFCMSSSLWIRTRDFNARTILVVLRRRWISRWCFHHFPMTQRIADGRLCRPQSGECSVEQRKVSQLMRVPDLQRETEAGNDGRDEVVVHFKLAPGDGFGEVEGEVGLNADEVGEAEDTNGGDGDEAGN